MTLPEEREVGQGWEPPGNSAHRRSLLSINIQQDASFGVPSVDVDGRPVTAGRVLVEFGSGILC